MVIRAVVTCLLMAGAVSGAGATAFCETRKTADGFVALRAGPSPDDKLVLRLKSGEMVQLDSTVPRKKAWVFVHYWQEGAIRHSGWVNRALIEKECG